MNAGKLRHRVTIQERADTRGTNGEIVEGWADVETIWAEVVPVNGRELSLAKSFQASVSHRITIRYRDDLTPKHRFTMGSRAFSINAILNENERNRMLSIFATEGV